MSKSSQNKLAELTHPRNWKRLPLLDRSRLAPDQQRPAEQFWAQPQQFVLDELCSFFKYRAMEKPPE